MIDFFYTSRYYHRHIPIYNAMNETMSSKELSSLKVGFPHYVSV